MGSTELSVAVLGMGYVGLPTALAFRDAGVRTIGIDIDSDRLGAIERGEVDVVPHDRRRLQRFIGDPDFVLSADPKLLGQADVVVICVPTPVDAYLQPDTTILRAACGTVVQNLRAGQTVLLSSTSYAGSTREMLAQPIAERGDLVPGVNVFIASSPERVDPGNAAFPVGTVPRVVGGLTAACGERAARAVALISPSVHIVSSPEAAELTKLVENSFRAVNIALANETAEVCRALGLDAGEVIDAAATKPYGFMAFRPGIGVGGHCIPCDPHYLLWQLHRDRISAPLIAQAMEAIAARPRQVVEHVTEMLSANGRGVSGSRILVVGVAYKPGVRDVRESPGLAVIHMLRQMGGRVDYHDPMVEVTAVGDATLRSVALPEAEDYDAIVVGTIHPGFDYGWLRDADRVVDSSRSHSDRRADVARIPGSPHRELYPH
jgi:UDP-N-acetyl-D-glucosamine dehydrogenase